MKRAILFLSLAIVLQLALALGLRLADNSGKAAAKGGRLLAVSPDQIDTVQIEGNDGNAVLMHKIDGKWKLPEHFDAPADKSKINDFVTTLVGIERSWPVAESGDAIKRFKVADQDFERRLHLKAGNRELAVLLLGTSPGFRKVHARLAGEKQVFDIPFSTYQASLKTGDWVDKQQLWIDSDTINAIELPDGLLSRADDKWTLANLAANEETDQGKARQLIQKLARLNIQDVYAKADDPLPGPVELSIRLSLNDGTTRRCDFVKKEDQGHALVKGFRFPLSLQGRHNPAEGPPGDDAVETGQNQRNGFPTSCGTKRIRKHPPSSGLTTNPVSVTTPQQGKKQIAMQSRLQ